MSLEVNKIAAAVLTAGVTFMVAGVIGETVVHPHKLERSALAVPEPAAAPSAEPVAIDPIGPLLAAANVDNGRAVAQRLCSACHTFTQGGANGAGPNLYGIIGNHHAHVAGFNYSAGMRALAEKPWDYEALNVFLHKPTNGVPGTRMGFAGLNNNGQRADLIAFLRSLDPSPKPLP